MYFYCVKGTHTSSSCWPPPTPEEEIVDDAEDGRHIEQSEEGHGTWAIHTRVDTEDRLEDGPINLRTAVAGGRV